LIATFIVLFWVFAALVAYVYFGYPLLLALLARLFPAPESSGNAQQPPITLLISAFNERQVIAEKIENALQLAYPREQLEIVVISDCSDDGTDEIVQNYAPRGVRLIRQQQRLGKTPGLNLAIPQTTGQILVFSDANAIYQPEAILRLVRRFSDRRVGYVVGNARYLEGSPQSAAESEGLYWKLETWLKQKESVFGSVVGGDGAIYAIRRELFTPLRPTDINDFLNPLQIIARNYRGVYETSAICFEHAGESFEKEFRRKVRIISRSLNAVFREPRVLLPWVQWRHWLALVSHKVLRWLVPVFLLVIFATSLTLLKMRFFQVMLGLQFAFYTLATIGFGLERRGRSAKIFYLPYYFVLVNTASLLGIFRFATGSLSATWQTVRQPDPTVPAAARAARKES
jgi:cellulose synthase/poly-beta-1,6-N-acetylglucosamine synthase-like glycosyltransferase